MPPLRTLFGFYILSILSVSAVNIVLSNDDGWSEINIRAFYDSLTAAGDSVVISAPAHDQSGRGSLDAPPTPLITPCEFNSCPAGSPATGTNVSMPRFNYVNSFPVTAMRYGIQTLAPSLFAPAKAPDIAVAGPNVGANAGDTVIFSGTVGATTEAVKRGIPAIAFSGTTGTQTAWNAVPQTYELVYASLATNVTQTLTRTAKPYLPANIWLNVNFPAVSAGHCDQVGSFKFVMSRIFPFVPRVTPKDTVTCGNGGRLPTEHTVLGAAGCYASISVGQAKTKLDASPADQAKVLQKLTGFLSCLPARETEL